MSRPNQVSRLLCLFVISACSSAGGGDPVQELCELTLSCACSEQPFATVDACVTDLNMRTEALKNMAMTTGLIFSQSCRDSELRELHDGYGCSTEFTGDPGCSYCSAVHGDLPVGAACRQFDANGDLSEIGEFSDCAANLYCLSSRCIDLCEDLTEGAPCMTKDYALLGFCGDGLYCSFNTLLCEPEAALGDDCETGGCKVGLVCATDKKCAPEPLLGEPCSFICAGDLVCSAGICDEGPGEGDPCGEGSECAAGLECFCASTTSQCVSDNSFVCVAIEPRVCEYLTEK